MQKKEKIQLGITAILIIVLFFAVIRAIKRSKQATQAKTKGSQTTEEISQEKISGKGVFKIQEEEGRKLALKRDPFTTAPIMPKGRPSGGIYLSGILWSETKPMAIINDAIVGIGDKVGLNTVVGIKQDRVILNDGSRDLELRLQ